MDEGNNISQVRQERFALLRQRAEIEKAQLQEAQLQEQTMNQVASETPYENAGSGMSNSSSKNVERGKSLTYNNKHSILGDNKNSSGFINMVIMALLAGFASGAIATAIYIFINLGKVTFTL